MKKLLVFFILLLFLAVGRLDILASPNTGPLPEGCIKIEFSPLLYPEGWVVTEGEEQTMLVKYSVILTLFDFVYKDDSEIIGFSWTLEGASAEFWVKHGTTEAQYDSTFITSDEKGVSNAVWCLVIEEDPDDEIDEEDPDDEPEDEIDEEDPEDEPEDEVEGDDDEEPEDPVGDGEPEEELPDLGATGIAGALFMGLLGISGLWFTRKKE